MFNASALRVLLALTALGPLSGGVEAQGRPMLFGKGDFEMEWLLRASGDIGAGKMLRVQYLAAKRRLRIEALDGSDQVMIRDLASGKVVVLVANGAKGAFGTMAKLLGEFRPEAVGDIREIAGNRCRDFQYQARRLCVSDDGIPVEVDFGNGRLTATRILRKPQLPALFEVPKDLVLRPVPGASASALPSIPF